MRQKRNLYESDMTGPLRYWLTNRGMEGYTEVIPPLFGRSIDMIGWDGGENLVAIEMKRSLTDSVIHQAHECTGLTDSVYCAVQTYPRKGSIKKCYELGVGILSVRDGFVYEILPFTVVHGHRSSKYRYRSSIRYNRERMEKLFSYLRKRGTGGDGGVPNTRNNGPARDVRDRILSYRQEHPDADWKELFANVANHYASPQSMRQAQGKLEEWIAMRDRKKVDTRVLLSDNGLR